MYLYNRNLDYYTHNTKVIYNLLRGFSKLKTPFKRREIEREKLRAETKQNKKVSKSI